MFDKRKKKFYIDSPVIVLNGLVTDKNQYSYEDKIELLRNKKKLKEKKLYIKDNSSHGIKSTKKISRNKPIINNEKVILLSEDSDSKEEYKINSEIKTSKRKNNKKKRINNNTVSSEDEISFNTRENNNKKRKIGDNKIINNNKVKAPKIESTYKIYKDINKIENHKKNISNIINDDSDNENISNNSSPTKYKNKKYVSDEFKLNINYKKVEESNDYENIRNNCKNNSCVYIPIFKYSELKSVVEQNSRVLQLFKKIKKERKDEKEKENIIISEENQEQSLISSLNKLLEKKEKKDMQELFKKLHPDCNNILKYLPNNYCGINNFGFMNINSYSNEEKIHFITPFFKDKTNQYALKFRKYILNLSTFTSFNQNNDNNDIYHIIIPKDNLKNLDINFNEQMDLNILLEKLNCEYYFYSQKPGELLIVEPGCVHLSYYYIKKYNQDKNYLLMFWNKMNIDSFSDYMCLKNDCIKEEYKHLPILTMLLHLINKKFKYLSGDNIKTILEIYNKMDSYENINNYINEINNNNISFYKLYLNGVDLCNKCNQELFNFYVYNNEKEDDINKDNKNNSFICINCAFKKNLTQKSIIFFKYSKEDINLFMNQITTNINKDKSDIKENNKDEIISECFNLDKREDDCLNVDELILKIDGPLNVVDKDFENNKNYFLPKNIKVDKYLKFIENDRLSNISINPLDKSNFKNDINENDIYENLNKKEFSINNNQNIDDNKPQQIIINNKDNEDKLINNFSNLPSFSNIFIEDNNLEDKKIEEVRKESINKENKQSKKKKKKIENIFDLIENGDF